MVFVAYVTVYHTVCVDGLFLGVVLLIRGFARLFYVSLPAFLCTVLYILCIELKRFRFIHSTRLRLIAIQAFRPLLLYRTSHHIEKRPVVVPYQYRDNTPITGFMDWAKTGRSELKKENKNPIILATRNRSLGRGCPRSGIVGGSSSPPTQRSANAIPPCVAIAITEVPERNADYC